MHGLGRLQELPYGLRRAMTASFSDAIAKRSTQTILLDGELAKAEPKTLRYRMLPVAARITEVNAGACYAIAAQWPSRHELAAASAPLTVIVRPLRT